MAKKKQHGRSTKSGKKPEKESSNQSKKKKGSIGKGGMKQDKSLEIGLEQEDQKGNLSLSELPTEFKQLTLKQTLFIIHYAVTRNGVEAVRMAGYTGTYQVLQSMAYENLRKPDIIKALDAYLRPMFEKHGLTVDRIIENIADIALSPWRDHIQVKMKDGEIVEARMQMSAKVKMLEVAAKMMRLIGDRETDIQQFIDSSQNIHVHAKTPDEARRALLDFLKKRK